MIASETIEGLGIILTSDKEGRNNKALHDKLSDEFTEANIHKLIFLENGDITDHGKNNATILSDIIRNYESNVLGNRDLNLLKRINILTSNTRELEELLLPEIDYYNKTFTNKEKDKLVTDYIDKKEYNRPDNLMWSSGERLLKFLLDKNYLSFEENGNVQLSENFNNTEDWMQVNIELLQWDCEKNQGAPNYLLNVLNEILNKKYTNLGELLKNESASHIQSVLLEFNNKYVIPALRKSKFVFDNYYLFNTHSSIREDVLFIPKSIINLLALNNEGKQLLENIKPEYFPNYVDVFKNNKETYKVKTIEEAGKLYNKAWEIFWLNRDNIEEVGKLNAAANKAAEKDFIQLGLPNNPQGFCTASQVRNTSERRSADELFALKKIVAPNRKLLINFVGHKPSVFPSLNLQEVENLNIYTIRIDQSTNGGSANKILYNNDSITIESVHTPQNSIFSEADSNYELIPQNHEIRNKYVIDINTGKLLRSSQIINDQEIELPLANRYHEKHDNREWRIISAKLKPNKTDIEGYILTSVAGDEPFDTAKGLSIPKWTTSYRCVTPEQLKYDYNLIPIEARELKAYEQKQNPSLNNQHNNLYSGIFSYRFGASATLLAGIGLTAASLLTDFPYLEVGVAIAGAVLAVIIISAVVDLLNKQWHGPSLFSQKYASDTSNNSANLKPGHQL